MEYLTTGNEMSIMDKLGILTDAAKYLATLLALVFSKKISVKFLVSPIFDLTLLTFHHLTF